jgi:inositol polyphosphate 5-phosphatase INPP5B/F
MLHKLTGSEKNRCPSWTDRILWKSGLPVKPLRYSSFPIYTMSMSFNITTDIGDHKPVSALFDVCLEAIIPNRFQEVHANVLRELDRLENDARPTVSLSSEELHFDEINFLEPITRSVVLQNSGTVSPMKIMLTSGHCTF